MNSELYGYNGKILNVDLAAGTCAPETRDEKYWRIYGGGGLVATALLLERTPPHIDPLSPENLLVFASSVVAGQPGPGLARFTVAAKSPLTGGIGETRAEGPWGIALKSSGFDVLAITGRCESPCILVIEDGSPRIVAVPELWGMGVGETIDELERKFGDDIHVAAIGPAGEHSVRYASVVAERGNQAARMGMGAVMGAKNLKAVVLRGGTLPPVYDRAALDSLGEYFTQAIDKNDLSRWQYEAPGFSCWIYLHGLDAAFGVNNYSKSQIDNIDGLKEERFLEHSIEALPCPGCSNDCIKSISPFGQSGAAAGDAEFTKR